MGICVLPLQILELPPGFRFHPTAEEIITCYLREKVMDKTFTAIAIAEVDLNKSEPWDLPGKSKMGEKEWFFFCERDRKYPTGQRRNRATESGYWKATGKDKEIYTGKRCLVGRKKTLVFYKGKAPKGDKTNWVMHEYRLDGNLSSHHKLPKDQWVICRVFHKKIGVGNDPVLLDSFMDNLLDNPSALPCLIEMPLSSDNTRTSRFATNEHNMPAAATSFDEIPSSASFNNYNYKQNQLLREEDKSYGSFLPAEHIFTSTNNDYQHTYNNLASFPHDQILLTNSFFSEFKPIQNYALERPQKDSSNNNSMISLSRHSHVANEISSVTPNQGFDRGKQFEDNFKDQDLSVDPIAADLYSIWNY